MNDEQLYRFYWRGGTTHEGYGFTPEDAMMRLGFGAGAIAALDYWERVYDDEDQS